MKTPIVQLIPHSQLTEDPDNVRTHMEQVKLDSLKKSIRKRGVRTPLEVWKIEEDCYEVVAGNRRHRAVGQLLVELDMEDGNEELVANLKMVPVIVIGEDEVEDRKYLQLIENLQREDLDPLDEANGYRWLVENHHDTPAGIAEQTGMSAQHIRNRLRIPDAPSMVLKALAKGLVSAKHCELVAGLPSQEDREALASRVLNPIFKDTPLTVEETKEMIRADFMVRLNRRGGPGFDPEDGDLVPEAGKCSECPFLAKNNEEVQSSSSAIGKRGVDPNMCLNPACCRNKARVALARLAEDDGRELLSDSVCERIFGGVDGEIAFDSDFVALDDKPSDRDTGHFGKVPKWRRLVGDLDVPIYLGRNPHTGKVVELIDREMAMDGVNARANAKGEPSPFQPSTPSSRKESSARKRADEKEREKLALEALDQLVERMFSKGVEEKDIDALIATELQETPDALVMFRRWLKPKAKNDSEAIGEIIELIGAKGTGASVCYLAAAVLSYGLRWNGVEDPNFRAFAERFGLEVDG